MRSVSVPGNSWRSSSSPRRDSAVSGSDGVAGADAHVEERQPEEQQECDHRYEDAPGVGHHRGRQPLPKAATGVALGVQERHAQRVHAGTEHRQDRRERRQAVDDRERDHDRPRPADRPEVAEPQEQYAEQPDGDGETGEENRSARRADGAAQRLGGRLRADLLAEAAHDEERVVDGHAEADHADDVRRVDRDREDVG
jgi:hypothetical protein